MRSALNLPPGPVPWPIVGHIPQFRRDPLSFVSGAQRAYGPVTTIHLGNRPIVLLSDPRFVRYILIEHPQNFTSRAFATNLRNLLGDGLLTIDGDFHRQQRRLVQPAFHRKRVESYGQTMVALTTEMLDTWQAGDTFDMARAMRDLTLRIVARALFDIDLAAESPFLGQAFTDIIENPVGQPFSLRLVPLKLPGTPYARNIAAHQRLDQFVYDLIARRRADGRDTGDVLSMLLRAQDEESGIMMTDRQVRDQTMTLFAAGHETTANALSWTFFLLAQHPSVCERLLAQLRGVLDGRPPTVGDLPALPYLDWVISESLRLYPPAWTVGRRAIDAFELDGHHFAAGTLVMLSQWVMHRLPDIWGDPNTFRPERWNPVTAQKLPQGAYFPFGGGPRMCIGMPFAQLEARLLLATILQRFTPKLTPGYSVIPRPRVTLRPKHGMMMTLATTPATTVTTGAAYQSSGQNDTRSGV